MGAKQKPSSYTGKMSKIPRHLSGQLLTKLRDKKKMSKEDLSSATNISTKSISAYEKDGNDVGDDNQSGTKVNSWSPSLDKFLRIMDVLEPSVDELIELLSLDDLRESKTEFEYQSSIGFAQQRVNDDEKNRLEIFNGMKYYCYYYTHESVPLQVLRINKLSYGNGSYLLASANARKNRYRCLVTLTKNQQYALFDFESRDVGDSVRLVLPMPDRLSLPFSAGIGTVSHIYYPSGGRIERNPTFGMMAIVSETLAYRIGRRNYNVPESRLGSIPNESICEKGREVIGNVIESKKWLQLPQIRDEYLLSIKDEYLYRKSHDFFKSLSELNSW